MRIAVIGAGIAGNAAAWALTVGSPHEVTVYERGDAAGGHSATAEIDYDGVRLAVDTGFMVYNEETYPTLAALFRTLGIETQAAPMGFSVSVDGGRYEWAGRARDRLGGVFAQRRNLVSASHLRMLGDILRFNARAPADLRAGRLGDLSLGEYVAGLGLSAGFRDDYLLPMGAAIWSTSPAAMLAFPARAFVAFCDNHRLLHRRRPVWRTVAGGSRRYVERLTEPFRDRLRLGCPVARLERLGTGVRVTDEAGRQERFDAAVVAVHADQALGLLADADPGERAVLGPVSYGRSDVYLHRDPSLMPRRRSAWSSWNVAKPGGPAGSAGCTYWMNAIQGLDPSRPVFVSLNPPRIPGPTLTFRRYAYEHPLYDRAAIAAQERLPEIQGRRRTWFCGAWTGLGFHEDGLVSGLEAARALGAAVPWPEPAAMAAAAE